MVMWRHLALAALAFALLACGTPTASAPPTAPASEFDRQWADLVAAAQQEGELVLIMGPGGYRYSGPLRDHFSRKFGIRVVATGGTGGEQVTRVSAERAAGRYTVDIAHLGVSSNVQLANAGMLVPIWPLIVHPEVLNQDAWVLAQPVYEDAQREFILDRQANAPPNLSDIYYN